MYIQLKYNIVCQKVSKFIIPLFAPAPTGPASPGACWFFAAQAAFFLATSIDKDDYKSEKRVQKNIITANGKTKVMVHIR